MQVTRGAGLDRAQDVGVGLVRGQHHHPGRRRGREHAGRRHHPVAPGHPQIHQYDVGLHRPGDRDRLVGRASLADHLDVRLGVQDARQSGADHRVVVDELNPDHASTSVRTVVPCPGCTVDRQPAAHLFHPITHGALPVAGVQCVRVEPAAVVGDLDRHLGRFEREAHSCHASAGVFADVREGLLHHPQQDHLDRRRQRAGRARRP